MTNPADTPLRDSGPSGGKQQDLHAAAAADLTVGRKLLDLIAAGAQTTDAAVPSQETDR